MNDASFLGLVQNSAFLLTAAFIFDVATSRWRMRESSFWQALVGLALGAIGIAAMLTPWSFMPGIVFDTRSILIGISGLFFGSIPAAITMAMTIAFRFYQGGSGAWTGVAVIFASGVIGIAWRHFRRRPLAEMSWQELYLFGMVVHLAMLGLMLTLPWATALRVLSSITLPVILIYPLGTALLGVFMVNRLRRERAGDALQESEERYRSLFNNNHTVMLIIDPDNSTIKDANPAACSYYGWSREELKQRKVEEINTLTNEEVRVEMELARSECRNYFLFKHRLADGTIRDVDVYSGPIMIGGKKLLYSIIHDITARKETKEALRKSIESVEELAKETAIIAKIGRIVGSTLDLDQVYEKVATEAGKLIPYDRFLVNRKVTQDGQFMAAYVAGMDNPRRRIGDIYSSRGSATGVVMNTRKGILIQPDDAEEIRELYPNLYETFKTGLRSTMSVPLISMDEVIGSMNFRSKKLKAYTDKDLRLAERIGGQVAGAIANAQLYSDLTKTEKLLRESNELFSLFMHHSPIYAFIKEVTPTQSIVLQASDNYRQMIGAPGCEMVGKTMAELFSPEFAAKITADDWAVVSKGDELRLDEELNGRSYTTVKFPIVWEDKTLLAGYTIDITDRKQAEKQLQDTLESLRKAVGTTIQVISSTVEARDPYTSGHQTRTSDLARAIAMEMGLPREKIEGIRMAGSIHDIGKISIPAEILSKPTKLSKIEFSLIKEHARKGYEMLKDVESPWPLAEIVHQHHERMDGSGYPGNLKGEEILMEARILSVADVVEAMASHRPYRPGLGIDAALQEIEKNSGIFYDKSAAEACLRLFRVKGYQLEVT